MIKNFKFFEILANVCLRQNAIRSPADTFGHRYSDILFPTQPYNMNWLASFHSQADTSNFISTA